VISRSRNRSSISLCFRLAVLCGLFSFAATPLNTAGAADDGPSSFAEVVEDVQPRMVKIYGVGGLSRLESYQSGFLISGEGHILTVLSYVLDSDVVTVNLDDGRRFEAELLGGDPQLEIAVLKIDAEGLPHFKLQNAAKAESGTRVLAFSNLFGVATGNEPASVQRGVISVKTNLAARSGAYRLPYRGDVYVLDAITSNPGAAGGALTDGQGRLLGLLGREVRSSLSNTWLNYALPAEVLREPVSDILAGKDRRLARGERPKPNRPLSLRSLGIILVPDVLDRTPPFVDAVQDDSPAAQAKLQADDLIVFVNDQLTQSIQQLRKQLEYIEYDARVKVTVMRDRELLDLNLQAEVGAEP